MIEKPKQFRTYGPTTQALERRTGEVQPLKAENADLKARLERLERLIQDRPYLTAATAPIQ